MRAFDAACQAHWLSTEGALRTVLRVAARRDLHPEAIAAIRASKDPNIVQGGRRGSVAIVAIDGTMFPKANLFTELSGGTSTEQVGLDLNAALADPGVGSILLHIDSPGGAANDIHALADMVRAGREIKPITAYVANLGASAAYWVASAASEIVCDEMALLGSIGVVAAVPNPHAEDDRDITFVSSQSPLKRPDPTSAEGKGEIQTTLDDMAAIFIGAVAANRGTTPETVAATFGQGGLFIARKAVAAGMADRIGSFEALVAELQQSHPARPATVATARTGLRGTTKKVRARMDDETTIEAQGEQMPDIALLQEQMAALQARIGLAEGALAEAESLRLLAESRNATLEAAARRKRFTDEVLGHANDGTRWLGAADDNVAYLETAAEVLGEDNEKFQAIVAHHRALAVQFRSAGVLVEVGTSQEPVAGPSDALARLEIEAKSLMAANGGLTLAQAKAQVVKDNTEIREALSRRGTK